MPLPIRQVALVASGDLRETANRVCWPAQSELEGRIGAALERLGVAVRRAHPYDERRGHGFIGTQREGMDVFMSIDRDEPVVVAEAVWQYSHNVLPGLRSHGGPILTAANWSGQWPGLVGLLNLNASLTKAGVPYSTIWSEDFGDPFAEAKLRQWVATGRIVHDTSHAQPFDPASLAPEDVRTGRSIAADLLHRKAILGVFDEGCMGMYNAIIDDEHLNPIGIFKERLSQSALVAEMQRVAADDIDRCIGWLRDRGMRFEIGNDPATELTMDQVRGQIAMYVAAVRIADRFGCDAIGIQYQQGLADMAPASDLAEGLLNDADRPPVARAATGETIRDGRPVTHFNEVDEGAGVDALVTTRVWEALGLDPSTTLHDVRWGAPYGDEFVWVFEISGAVPPSHLAGGYRGAVSERQPPMYFPLGGGTIKGVSRPGEIVWSRAYLENDRLQFDLGRGRAIELPPEESQARAQATTPQWPMMHAVLDGVTRDQFMARHRSNHVNVVYAPDAATADRGLRAKAATLLELGVPTHLVGTMGQ